MLGADQIFESELKRKGIQFSRLPDKSYEVSVRKQMLRIELKNIQRLYERDQEPTHIKKFVENIEAGIIDETPSWNDVRSRIRYSLEPAEFLTNFDDLVFKSITADLIQVFVYVSSCKRRLSWSLPSDDDESRINWIHKSMLADWKVTREDLIKQAEENIAQIIDSTKLEMSDVDGAKIGMLATDKVAFKASLMLSPAFRQLVSQKIGWPVHAVVPCRDFVYVFPTQEHDLISSLGSIVVREFQQSGYPITKDVLEISESGVIPIGTYEEGSA